MTAAGDGAENRGLVRLLRSTADGALEDATAGSGLESVRGANACAVGDVNNDGNLDVYVACDGENRLLLGSGQGTFDDITAAAGAGGGEQSSRAALLLDSDHDADLDIFICNAPAAGGGATPDVANRLLNNNADGTFTDITEQAGVACPGEGAVAMTAADVDGDRDTDLVLLSSDRAVRVFTNELLASFRAVDTGIAPTVAARFGGALQDLTGDGIPDLVTLDPDVGGTAKLRLFAGDGRRKFAATAEAVVPALDGTALGLRGLRPGNVFAPILLHAKVTQIGLGEGRYHYTVEGAAMNDGAAPGVVTVEVEDTPDSAHPSRVKIDLPLRAVEKQPFRVRVPVKRLGRRQVTVRLRAAKTGQVIQQSTAEGIDRLNPLQAYLDRNYYTTERETRLWATVSVDGQAAAAAGLRVEAAVLDANGRSLANAQALVTGAETPITLSLAHVPGTA